MLSWSAMIAMFSWIGSVVGRYVRLNVWCAEARASSRTRNACKETQRVVYGSGKMGWYFGGCWSTGKKECGGDIFLMRSSQRATLCGRSRLALVD